MKYIVEVGSMVTRYVGRKIVIHADDEIQAKEKAIDKYIMKECKIISSVDFGTPQVDDVKMVL